MKERSKTNPLRKRAEKIVSEKQESSEKISSEDVKRLIHELRVHQVELEMQNEELRKAQAEIESSRSRYADLYDFAPAGYYTFDQKGIVKELNLSGANLLGVERSLIIDKPFQVFIAPEYADIFTHHRLSVLKNTERQRCELKLVRMDKTSFYASMESITTHDDTGNSAWIRSAILDITVLKKKEHALLKSEEHLKSVSLQLLNAQEEERKRIAGEIHDTIGSSLGAIKFKAENVLQQVAKGADATAESLNALILMIQECIGECRRIQMDLRPAVLDDLGLRAALSWFFRRFETTYSHIQIKEEMGIEEGKIPNPLKIAIYRVTQESLNNVVKHSKANHVSFSLKVAGKKIELSITDNGTGFDVEEILNKGISRSGLGLISMKERVKLRGGTLNVTATEGKGTTVHASWPIS